MNGPIYDSSISPIFGKTLTRLNKLKNKAI